MTLPVAEPGSAAAAAAMDAAAPREFREGNSGFLKRLQIHLSPPFSAPKRRGPARLADPRPLFEDTSASGGSPGRGFGAPPPPPSASGAAASSSSPPGFPTAGAFLAEPVSSLAAAYGSSLASHVEGNVSGENGGNDGGK